MSAALPPSRISRSLYDKSGIKIYENLKEALGKAISSLSKDEILYVLPTYSAMLDVRKILTGRSIL